MELVKDTSLSSHYQDLLLTLLIYYSDVFAWSKDELGCTDVLQHEIVTDGAAPICQRFGDHPREKSRNAYNVLKKNLISPMKSLWDAPIVLVKRKDGTCRSFV